MIKALYEKNDGTKVVLIGLTKANIALIKKDKPVHVKMSELGLEGELVICYFKNEREAELMFERNFSIGTKIGSACHRCGSGRRDDGTCDCLEG